MDSNAISNEVARPEVKMESAASSLNAETCEGQERTAVSTEAGQVEEAPHSTGHRNRRGIMPNETSDDEASSVDTTMIPGAVRIPGTNATLDDDDAQTTLFETSTSLAPKLVEAELALDLDEAIALGVQNTLQQAVQATAIPVRRKPWRIFSGIASVLLLAVAAILIVVLLAPKTPSETLTTIRISSEAPSPTEHRSTRLQSFLAPYFGDGFPSSETEQQALYWLAYEDAAMLMPPVAGSDNFDSLNNQLLERYIAVFFYFETGGGDWKFNGGWLSEHPVCRWGGVSCSDSLGLPIDEITCIILREFS
jgi:hypothetical protein